MTSYRDKYKNRSGTRSLSEVADLNKEEKNIFFNQTANKILANKEIGDLAPGEVESDRFLKAYIKQKTRYLPDLDYNDPSSFCFYGSAEKYYEDSISRIHDSYPYDGSKSERMEWFISSSYLDIHLFEHEYPKSTGYIKLSPSGWGSVSSTSANYGEPTSKQYIYFNGGPHKGNLYSASKKRESNIKIDGVEGNTVEFWLKKKAYAADAKREVIFDIHTNEITDQASSKFGRFKLELDTSVSDSTSPFIFTYLSGTAGVTDKSIGSALIKASVVDNEWHHYALSVQHTSSGGSSILRSQFYVDGELIDTVDASVSSFGPVDRHLVGTIGSLAAPVSSAAAKGWGKLSGSLDEFRYWKTTRNAKQINRYWYSPVAGGTDNDHSNAELGLYYKFNEGITSPTVDATILDYSGRISNGKFIGYASACRSDSSAITEATVLPETGITEIGDPIINQSNPKVTSLRNKLSEKGRVYDTGNLNSLVNTVPDYVTETDQELFLELLQILSSIFDDIYLKIKVLPKIKDYVYKDFFNKKGQRRKVDTNNFLLGCDEENSINFIGAYTKPWVNHILEHFGLVTTEIFPNAELFEYFSSRSKDITFEQQLEEVKNTIFSNIHRNLPYIYKTKGTEESFRNLIRCYGVDDELIKLNVYAKNEDYEIRNDETYSNLKIKALRLVDDGYQATVYPTSSVGQSDERHFITGSSSQRPYTVEGNFYFQTGKRPSQSFVKNSLFGMHAIEDDVASRPGGSGAAAQRLKWESGSPASFQVYVNRTNKYSSKGNFSLESESGLFSTVESPHFSGIYDGTHWNLSVRLGKYSDLVYDVAASSSVDTFAAEFTGYNYDLDILKNSFKVVSPITKTAYLNFSKRNKAAYLGAHRTNFSGSVLTQTDCMPFGYSVWQDKLTDEELQIKAQNPSYYGRKNPQSVINYDAGENILSGESLLLRWQFANITGSSATGNCRIEDLSSGSYQALRGAIGYKYPAKAKELIYLTGAVDQHFLPVVKYSDIANTHNSNRVKVRNLDLTSFEADSRPVNYFFTYEKSMYQSISEEMITFFAGLKGLNNLIGEPVNKYRHEYKALNKIKEAFFDKVENEIDLERYVEYYRWIDDSLSHFLNQLVPICSAFSDKIRDIVESHILERNKYQHKFPTLESKEKQLEAHIFGINELLYDWEHGHAPPYDVSVERTEELKSHAIYFPGNVGGSNVGGDDEIEVLSNKTVSFNNAPITRNSPPSTSLYTAGAEVIVGSSPSGDFAGHAGELATWNGSAWTFAANDYAANPGYNAFTISTWFSPSNQHSSTGQRNRQIIKKRYEYALVLKYDLHGMANIVPDKLEFVIYDQGTNGYSESNNLRWQSEAAATTLANGNFTHIVAVVDPTATNKISVFVNGTLVPLGADTTITQGGSGVTNMRAGTSKLQFGEDCDYGPDYLADTIFFNKALTSGEITELYNSGKIKDASQYSTYDDIISWWKMGEGDATGANGIRDSVGINHGTLQNEGSIVRYKSGNSPIVLEKYGDGSYNGGTLNYFYNWVNRINQFTEVIQNEAKNCLWWSDRASRTSSALSSSRTLANTLGSPINKNKEVIRRTYNTDVSGSTYAIRKFSRPYKMELDKQLNLKSGNNHGANKIKDLYKVINESGDNSIVLYSSNINEENQCIDLITPEKKKQYFAKTELGDVNSYTSGDASLILPFTLMSSSAGNDFHNFKQKLQIANNHSDGVGPDDEVSIRSIFAASHVGGMPHRHVPLTTTSDLAAHSNGKYFRPEAYHLTGADNGSWIRVEKIPTDRPKSLFYRDLAAHTHYNIKNIRYSTSSVVLGNYEKDYQIVMTSGRHTNNSYLIDHTASAYPSNPAWSWPVSGVIDHEVVPRERREHIISNRFSAIGGAASSPHTRDLESLEYSPYSTLNNKNLNIRNAISELHKERSNQFGKRLGNSNNHASVHMTNRNQRRAPRTDKVKEYVSKVIKFDGDSDYLEINATRSLFKDNENFSFFAWIKHPTVTETSLHSLFAVNSSSGGNRLIFGLYGTGVSGRSGRFVFHDTSTNRYITTTGQRVDDDKWHLVGLIYRGASNRVTLYLDGVEYDNEFSVDDFSSTLATNDLVSIGTEMDSGPSTGNWAHGYISNVSIWTKALSDIEIAELYTNGHAERSNFWYGYETGPANLLHHSAVKYLGAWYRMGDGFDESTPTNKDILGGDNNSDAGNRIYDMSPGTKYHATPMGTFASSALVDNQGLSGRTSFRSRYDNFFVSHPIPQTEFQYTWITASADKSQTVDNFLENNSGYGYQHIFSMFDPNTGNYLKSKDAILTITGSSEADFVGTNILVYEPLTSGSNTLEGTGSVRTNSDALPVTSLRALILHRQGPYGWPSWKQIRGASHPIARSHRKTNTYSLAIRKGANEEDDIINPSPRQDYIFDGFSNRFNSRTSIVGELGPGVVEAKETVDRSIINYKDIPITSRFNPICIAQHNMNDVTTIGYWEAKSSKKRISQQLEQAVWRLDEEVYSLWTQDDENPTLYTPPREVANLPLGRGSAGLIATKMSYQNEITTFAEKKIIDKLGIIEQRQHAVDTLISGMGQVAEANNSEMNYIEAVYPREINTFTKHARTRENFKFMWNSDRDTRTTQFAGSNDYSDFILAEDFKATANNASSEVDLNVFPIITTRNTNVDYRNSNSFGVEAFDLYQGTTLKARLHITASTWPLDSRPFVDNSLPVDIGQGWISQNNDFSRTTWPGLRGQGSKGEGTLQNDYSLYPLGYNALYGTPAPAQVYNRRSPQRLEGLPQSKIMASADWATDPSSTRAAMNNATVTYGDAEGNTRTLTFDDSQPYTTTNTLDSSTYKIYIGSVNTRYKALKAIQNGLQTVIEDGLLNLTASMPPVSSGDGGSRLLVQATTAGNLDTSTLGGMISSTGQFASKYAGNTTIFVNANPQHLLSGEAKWEAAEQSGEYPSKNTYEEQTREIRAIAQDHSVIPEFKISDFVEDIVANRGGDFLQITDNFLSLTGAVHNVSSGDLEVGSEFFKTYSTSDFMKYFQIVRTRAEEADHSPSRFTLKCNAALRFIPYHGFYPVERTQQLGEIFNRGYIPAGSWERQLTGDLDITNKDHYLSKKISGSLYQCSKPFFAPGVLYNSIKSGLAVDYPIFETNISHGKGSNDNHGLRYLTSSTHNGDSGLLNWSDLNASVTMGVTGSNINGTHFRTLNSVDLYDVGIPRLSGSLNPGSNGASGQVSYRVNFDNLLNPSSLFDKPVYDHEPHPSSSLYYGSADYHSRIIDYPFKFGTINTDSHHLKRAGLESFRRVKSLEQTLMPFKLAMNNFAAETVDFFLEGGSMGTLVSPRPVNFKLDPAVEYRMKVQITNENVMMYDRPSAFGPPVDEGRGLNVTKFVTTGGAAANSGFLTVAFNIDSSVDWMTTEIFTTDPGFDLQLLIDGELVTKSVRFWNESTPSSRVINTGDLKWVRMHGSFLGTQRTHAEIADDIAESLRDLGFVNVTNSLASKFIANISQPEAGALGNVSFTPVNGVSKTGVWYFNQTDASGGNNYMFSGVTNLSGGSNPSQGTAEVLTDSMHGHAPFTPPFLDPGAQPYALIKYQHGGSAAPGQNTVDVTLDDIFRKMTIEYKNFHTEPNNGRTKNTNFRESMSLSASLDLKEFVRYSDNSQNNEEQLQKKRWMIQTKWETPILDFQHVSKKAIRLDTGQVTTVTGYSPWKTRNWGSYYTINRTSTVPYLTGSTGMWHQYGRDPYENNAGMFLEIKDDTSLEDPEHQLGKHLGFTDGLGTTSTYGKSSLGKLKNKKEISEAVVAIPYTIDPDTCKVTFFNIETSIRMEANIYNETQRVRSLPGYNGQFGEALTAQQYKLWFENPGQSAVECTSYQMRMMDKYVIPPRFDFMRYKDVANPEITCPMMYIFQFRAELSKKDLQNIWQNIAPSSAKSAGRPRYSNIQENLQAHGMPPDVSYVSHFIFDSDDQGAGNPGPSIDMSYNGRFVSDNVRWLIFKAKKRAKTDLKKVKQRSIPVSPYVEDVSIVTSPEFIVSSQDLGEGLITYINSDVGQNSQSLYTGRLPDFFGENYGVIKDWASDEPTAADLAQPQPRPPEYKASYNWPYDFFSLVELIKVEAKVDFVKK